MRLELDEKRDVMRSLQETASRLCQENHPAKQTVEVNFMIFIHSGWMTFKDAGFLYPWLACLEQINHVAFVKMLFYSLCTHFF